MKTTAAKYLALTALLVANGAAAEANSLAPQVRHELVMLPYYSVFDNLAFEVEGAKVTLSGQVTRPTLRSAAERVVKRVAGVSQVVNEIDVLPVSSHDDDIRSAVFRAIYRQSLLSRYAIQPAPPIHIVVTNGDVTLEGVVNNPTERAIAGLQANAVAGVFSVVNNLLVETDERVAPAASEVARGAPEARSQGTAI